MPALALTGMFVLKVSAWDQPAVIVMIMAVVALALDGVLCVRRLRDPRPLSMVRRNWLLFVTPCRLIIGLPLVITGVFKALRWFSPSPPVGGGVTGTAMASVMPIVLQLLGLILVITACITVHQAWKRRSPPG